MSWTPAVQYAELNAGGGALSIAAEAHGGEIAMLTEKEPIARANLRPHFPNTKIIDDADGDSTWGKLERKPGAALGLLAGPPCRAFAPAAIIIFNRSLNLRGQLSLWSCLSAARS